MTTHVCKCVSCGHTANVSEDCRNCCYQCGRVQPSVWVVSDIAPEFITAVEFGYRCCEKGMNLQAAIEAARKAGA